MEIEQMIIKPITTPEYPDPTEARRYIRDDDGFHGYDHVFLEDATWDALCEIARERGCRRAARRHRVEFRARRAVRAGGVLLRVASPRKADPGRHRLAARASAF